MKHAVVLFGHGSRDPLWRAPMDALAARLRARRPETEVHCAFLELQEPDLAACIGTLVSEGTGCVTIVPVFFGVGRHAREDLPRQVEALRRAHPQMQLQVTPAVGEWDDALDALAAGVLQRT